MLTRMVRRFAPPAGIAGLLCLLAGAAPAAAQAGEAPPASPAPVALELPAVSAAPPLAPRPGVHWYPGYARESQLRGAFLDAIARENDHDYAAAARIFEALTAHAPDEPHTYWRIARDYVLLAELMPPSASDERARYGTLAMAWADRGLDIDPNCGECCLYKYAGMGRVAVSKGILSSMSWLGQIRETLDQCLAMPPTFVHEPWNPERGNLYYAASTFYRVLPDSRMLELSAGVRGNAELALEFSRRAVALAGDRVDYNVGLGAALLCAATRQEQATLLEEGRSVLRHVPALVERMPTDSLDRRAARRLLESPPEAACGYSRDDWYDDDLHVARQGE
jgi:hypothetical protein